jgi:hypothetical protein
MTEKELHKQICTYLKYKGVLFNTDLSGLKMTMGQAQQIKALRCCNGFPDITVYEPKGSYAALFLEVKKSTPYKVNGELYSNDHLHEQEDMMKRLNDKGYYATFVWGFDSAKETIDWYLGL